MEHYAQPGFIWKRRDGEEFYGNILLLGKDDSLDRFEQVPERDLPISLQERIEALESQQGEAVIYDALAGAMAEGVNAIDQ